MTLLIPAVFIMKILITLNTGDITYNDTTYNDTSYNETT
jgi:hypothetical protein